MLKRNYLLIGLMVLLLLSIYGWLHIKLGIDFQGGTLITIASDQPITISKYFSPPYRLNEKHIANQYVYEVEIPNPVEVEKASRYRNELIACAKNLSLAYSRNVSTQPYLDKCNKLMDMLSSISQLTPPKNISVQEFIDFADTAYYKILDNFREQIKNKIPNADVELSTITPTLSKTFFEKMKQVFLLAIIFVSIVVLYIFRTIIPSLIVISGALTDIFIVLGLMGLLNIPLSFSTFAALLVILGYSLDTDVLLTSRYFKSKNGHSQVILDTMNTGISMTTTGILAFIILLAIGYVLKITFYQEIALVVLMGLVVDIFTTWGLNAYLLEKLGGKHE